MHIYYIFNHFVLCNHKACLRMNNDKFIGKYIIISNMVQQEMHLFENYIFVALDGGIVMMFGVGSHGFLPI